MSAINLSHGTRGRGEHIGFTAAFLQPGGRRGLARAAKILRNVPEEQLP
ncbi:MAG: hypothetical protein AVDCRST_MAG93-3462 [uncultured Chloroflexia bacterium]|uniref:Uncharacterized protein n=1 Tax=uncultured Chloroflexia bacterium TaxID=1672391 RepID=A0A6J4JR32_9CHLR|nr:MAG: hypothetical protein AVDCRST_MAG93-3462 [uncultured Chloroflexia bacterium]